MSLSRPLVVTAIVFLLPCAALATTWNVAQTGCNDTSCAPCCTIQGAVYKSVGGDTISVAPGTYPEIVDFRFMLSVGDITLEAASGPGTVFISSSADEPLRHSDSYTNTVTLDGLDITSGGGYSCVYFNHLGNAVLRDVTANDCGYTAIMLDNPGTVVMERCTANSSGRTGIQIDGASSATVTDCTANSNDSYGFDVYSLGTIDIVNPTAVGNWDGLRVVAVAPTTITNAASTDNGRDGIVVETTSSLFITNPSADRNAGAGMNLLAHGSTTITNGTVSDNISRGIQAMSTDTVGIDGTTVSGNVEGGIDIEWDGVDPVDQVTLTNVDVSGNGVVTGERGVRLRSIEGPVVVTNCTFDNNGDDGFSVYETMIGDLEIYGGHAHGNGDDGFDLSATGNATVVGVAAGGNGDQGFELDMPGNIFFQNCVANDNGTGAGFDLQWREPDPLDGASVIDCTANNNGLLDGGNGIRVKHIVGPVTVAGTTTNGNSWTGVRVDDAAGSVLIRNAVSSFGLEEGIKIDTDVGPVTILDCTAEGNATEGLVVSREDVDVENIYVRRNAFVANVGTGVALFDLGGTGLRSLQCNDIAGNGFGMYLESQVTVDAQKVWWGNTTGPSDQGPGTGDGIFAEPGGEILHAPWLMQSISSPLTDCEMFGSGFESGLMGEWDQSSQ